MLQILLKSPLMHSFVPGQPVFWSIQEASGMQLQHGQLLPVFRLPEYLIVLLLSDAAKKLTEAALQCMPER